MFGCHGLSSFHKLLLGNPTRQLALFLSILTTHSLKYNEIEAGALSTFPTVFLPRCLIDELRAER